MPFDLKKTISEAFTGVFIVRLLAGIFFAGATAWGVAFKTSDYVVRANTSSAKQAMQSLQASIENFNSSFQVTTAALQSSIEANTRATEGLEVRMVELLRRSEVHSAAIENVKEDVGKVAAAVQDAGIAIRIDSAPINDGKIFGWGEVYDAMGGSGKGDIYIKLPSKSLPVQD